MNCTSLQKKLFVLDTNVLLHDPRAFANFGNNDVVIPLCVIRELDRKKSVGGVLGANARAVAAALDVLCNDSDTTLDEGIVVNEEGGTVSLFSEDYLLGTEENVDDVILGCCVALTLYHAPDRQVILVTKDRYLRLTANYRNVHAEDYRNDKVDVDGYTGQRSLQVTSDMIDRLYSEGFLDSRRLDLERPLYNNECVKLTDSSNPKHGALAIAQDSHRLELIPTSYNKVLNLKALNAEQRFAIRVLTDPTITLVSISGATGSGKTILAVAAALQQVERRIYKQVIVSRTEVPVGRSQGYLAGSIKEKTEPWLAGIYGCLDQLVGCKDTGGKDDGGYKAVDFYLEQKMLRSEPFAYIRGVTWLDSIVVLDEAQNAHLHELKAMITRAGEGREGTAPSKVILMGDNDQIDNEYLDSYSNGLAKVIERFKGWKHYAHLTLEHTVRSDLAREAGRRL